MNKKRFTAIGLVLLMLISMMVMLSGCSIADAKAEKEYYDQVSKFDTNITESAATMKSAIDDLDITDESSKKTVIDAISAVEKDFKDLAALKAPKKYEEVQKDFNDASAKALQALTIYKTEVTKLNAKSSENDLEAAKTKLMDGDKYMEQAADALQKGADKADKLDGITTKSSKS